MQPKIKWMNKINKKITKCKKKRMSQKNLKQEHLYRILSSIKIQWQVAQSFRK